MAKNSQKQLKEQLEQWLSHNKATPKKKRSRK